MNRVVVSGAAESPQIETKRRPDMTQTAVIPDYLKPAMERLETARSAHLANASRM
ncbi:glycoprotein 3, partial [Salmonella enterica subsp. enterica serovar Kentucky]|nr:glycoprotein 3 [Salmonella enterica subsp. enterica serovar Kentucky]